MKKITILFAVFIAAVLCVTVSCKDKNKNSEPEQPAAKFLTAVSFASSLWTGSDSRSNEVTLNVTSTSDMTLTYFSVLSKNTDNKTKKAVKIAYTFDETQGTFSGKGDDNAVYSGELTSITALKFKMPDGEILMSKK